MFPLGSTEVALSRPVGEGSSTTGLHTPPSPARQGGGGGDQSNGTSVVHQRGQRIDRINRNVSSEPRRGVGGGRVGLRERLRFVGCKAGDLRLSDLPALIGEYHQLVSLCEELVVERSELGLNRRR
ncbi:unnamed protein product [Choristocarpus tenellus]